MPGPSVSAIAVEARAALARTVVPARGLGSADALAGDLLALRALIDAAQVRWLQLLAAADAEDAAAVVAPRGTLATWLRDEAGVSTRETGRDLALARRLFTLPTERGGIPEVGAALARLLDEDSAASHDEAAAPVVTATQARLIHHASDRLSAEAAVMVADTLLSLAPDFSVDTLAQQARLARQAGLDHDQPDPVADLVEDVRRDDATALTAREQLLREGRFCTMTATLDGYLDVHAFLPPEAGAALQTALDALSRPEPAADGTRDPRSARQRRADALGRLAAIALTLDDLPSRQGARPHVLVHVDLADLLDRADHEAVRVALAATTGGASPAYAALARDRLGLLPKGMVDLTRLVDGRWIATREAAPHHRPDGVPGSQRYRRRRFAQRLGPPEGVAADASPDVVARDAAPHATSTPCAGGHRYDVRVEAPESLFDLRPPTPADAVSDTARTLGLVGDADPALIQALLAATAPSLGGTTLDVLAFGRTRRTASPTQRVALAVRDRGCTVPGCDRPAAWCDADHEPTWSDGGLTNLTALSLLCGPHHRDKTERERRARRDTGPRAQD